MKSVSLIVQFVIFFVIGLGFFLLAGNLFRFQSDLIKQEIIDASSRLSLDQLSAAAIRAVDSCKSCSSVKIKIEQKSIVGYIPTYELSTSGLTLKIEPENKIVQSQIHNLCSPNSCDSSKVSSKSISLTYVRTNNKLVIE